MDEEGSHSPPLHPRFLMSTSERPNLQRSFTRIYLSQTDDMPRNECSDAPENDSFALSFVPLGLRRKCKEDYLRVGESTLRNL